MLCLDGIQPGHIVLNVVSRFHVLEASISELWIISAFCCCYVQCRFITVHVTWTFLIQHKTSNFPTLVGALEARELTTGTTDAPYFPWHLTSTYRELTFSTSGLVLGSEGGI